MFNLMFGMKFSDIKSLFLEIKGFFWLPILYYYIIIVPTLKVVKFK